MGVTKLFGMHKEFCYKWAFLQTSSIGTVEHTAPSDAISRFSLTRSTFYHVRTGFLDFFLVYRIVLSDQMGSGSS